MSLRDRYQEIRHGFEPTFWVANSLELFERLAFYGSKAVLVVLLANRVGLQDEAGTLAGLFSGLIFSLPVVAGVFVDKYGFKRTLMACFAIFCVGYFLIGMAGMEFGQHLVGLVGKKPYVITVLLLTAMGGSLIKPCIVGTVDRTSRPDAKALGFSIYYTLVNIGGAVGPLVALQVREGMGIEFVLVMSSCTSAMLLLGTILFFKEPVVSAGTLAQPARTFARVFQDMLLVFGNARFIAFLVIFSGFWIMFWQIFFLLPFYTLDVLGFERFEILETVDAWCIIVLTVPVTMATKRLRPISAITLGLFLSSLSWVVVGAGLALTATVIGIAVYALGEAIQSPRFYEYVGSLAPEGQTGTFMGFAFLPVAIGAFTAGPVADWLRASFMETNPSMMWYIVSAIGITSTALMLIYNRFVARGIKGNQQKN